jgi:4'-phosphopantetheinyl transferase EntD
MSDNQPASRLSLPGHCGLVCLHTPVQNLVHTLSDVERRAISKAVDKRRQEYATGRWLAHQALTALGVRVQSIPTGPNREPVWPGPVKGSITHTDGHVAVAVTADPAVAGVGIDLERAGQVGDSILPGILTDRERARLGEVDPTLLFSAKESCFKVLFPIFREYVEFHAVEVKIDEASGSFTMSYLGDRPGHEVIEQALGSFQQIEGCWLTCVSLAASME